MIYRNVAAEGLLKDLLLNQDITEGLLKEVKASNIFALILDETSEISNNISYCLGFADSSNDIREEFLKFIRCDEGVNVGICLRERQIHCQTLVWIL